MPEVIILPALFATFAIAASTSCCTARRRNWPDFFAKPGFDRRIAIVTEIRDVDTFARRRHRGADRVLDGRARGRTDPGNLGPLGGRLVSAAAFSIWALLSEE